MKTKIAIIVLLAVLCSTQSHAQSFLENLGQSIKKEIKKEVKKGVEKTVNEGVNKLKDAIEKGVDEKQASSKQDKSHKTAESAEQASKPVVNPTDVPITTMNTWRLAIKDGKPHYMAIDGTSLAKENYILFDVKYEHPDGVEPFMFTTAVATFKAKDGYYFDKQLKLNDQVQQAENTTGFKRIDAKTVKVYLTAFTDDMGYDARISPAMKEYKDKISKIHMIPVATAKMNTPLFD